MNQKSGPNLSAPAAVQTLVDRAFGLATRALAHETSATRLLIRQHDDVKALFEKLEKAPTGAAKSKVFEDLATNLVAHDAIEREIFYPACEKALGMTDLLGEALVEHGVIEFCLYEADQAQARQGQDFAFKCEVLSEMVQHHVKEEERDFFPKVEKALKLAELDALGKRMQARFTQAKAGDFRSALHDNLKKVLAGALKPSAGKSKTKSQAAKKSRPASSQAAKKSRPASSKAVKKSRPASSKAVKKSRPASSKATKKSRSAASKAAKKSRPAPSKSAKRGRAA